MQRLSKKLDIDVRIISSLQDEDVQYFLLLALLGLSLFAVSCFGIIFFPSSGTKHPDSFILLSIQNVVPQLSPCPSQLQLLLLRVHIQR